MNWIQKNERTGRLFVPVAKCHCKFNGFNDMSSMFVLIETPFNTNFTNDCLFCFLLIHIGIGIMTLHA